MLTMFPFKEFQVHRKSDKKTEAAIEFQLFDG